MASAVGTIGQRFPGGVSSEGAEGVGAVRRSVDGAVDQKAVQPTPEARNLLNKPPQRLEVCQQKRFQPVRKAVARSVAHGASRLMERLVWWGQY
ncbi:MAG: hypothetical protein WD049_04410 [Candidatus Paceibacterota bacterium]